MKGLSEEQLLLSILAVALILVIGRGSAELARRWKQAEVLGELLGGFLIGPSVLGALLPSAYHAVFLNPGVGLALSMLSWIGAILILLIAGLEVDLKIVRKLARPGGLTAFFAITSSIIAGTMFGRTALGSSGLKAFFLGIVLSVTGVSVIAKILIERDSLRRGYAQVILAAGVASEVIVWPVISVVASFHGRNPWVVGARSAAFVLLFFGLMMTVGRRFIFWAMRRTADLTQVVSGQLSLVLVLAFACAAITLAMGLHPLLGAFFGVVLSQAPRTTAALKESVQALAVGLFAPVFFVLAGMRVDIFRLRSASAITIVLLLFVLATVAKSGMAALGARLGGMRGWESALVGVGVNLKGGTDVIVAILGAELGLLSTEIYTMYAVVAILTVLVSPSLVEFLERKVAPSQAEMERLNREEARRRAYFPTIERVLVPVTPELSPSLSAGLVQTIAVAKQSEDEIFDITELLASSDGDGKPAQESELAEVREALDEAAELDTVELTTGVMTESDPALAILEASKRHNLVVVAAEAPIAGTDLSFGKLQDRIIQEAQADVMVVVRQPHTSELRRILVPVNGHEHSMAAADIAAYIAKASNAEVVLLTVVHSRFDSLFWREREHRRLFASGYRLLREVKFRVDRLGVKAAESVQLGTDVGEAVLKELRASQYDLILLGTVDRSTDGHLQLGRWVQIMLTQSETPALLLVTHPGTRA